MSYQENLDRLIERFPIPEDCVKYLKSCGEYYRHAVIAHNENHDKYWIGLFESQADAMDNYEASIREQHGWIPCFLVDLSDLTSWQFSVEIRLGIRSVTEIGYDPT